MINPNLARWIYASLAKHVKDGSGSVPLYLDSQQKQVDGLSQWLELYVIGPSHRQPSNLWHHYQVEVAVGCQSRVDNNDSHKLQRLKGLAQSILSQDIKIYKYGDTLPTDDQSYIGCLKLRDDVSRPIDGMDFGLVSSDLDVERSTVEGHYEMDLDF